MGGSKTDPHTHPPPHACPASAPLKIDAPRAPGGGGEGETMCVYIYIYIYICCIRIYI